MMNKMKLSVFLPVICWSLVGTLQEQVIPGQYLSFMDPAIAVNGSLVTGNCSDINPTSGACVAPRSSVLFDGVIPQFTGLDGDTWASQLLVTPSTPLSRYATSVLAFYFTGVANYAGVKRVEMAIFNCPEWGISVGSITVQEFRNGRVRTLAIQSISSTSCDSLVRVCVPVSTNSTVIPITFHSVPSPQFYVHLAEVAFYADSAACPPEAVISDKPVTTQGSPDPGLTTASGSSSGSTPCSTQSEVCPSCTKSNSRASVITAIATAILATVVLTIVQIAVCKCCCCCPKLRAEKHRVELDSEIQGPFAVQNNGAYIRSIRIKRNDSYINRIHLEQNANTDTNSTDTNTVTTDTIDTNTIKLEENEAYTHAAENGHSSKIDQTEAYINTRSDSIELEKNEAYMQSDQSADMIESQQNEVEQELQRSRNQSEAYINTQSDSIELEKNEAYMQSDQCADTIESQQNDETEVEQELQRSHDQRLSEAYINTQSDSIELEKNEAYMQLDQSVDTVESRWNSVTKVGKGLQRSNDHSEAYINTQSDSIELEKNEAYVHTHTNMQQDQNPDTIESDMNEVEQEIQRSHNQSETYINSPTPPYQGDDTIELEQNEAYTRTKHAKQAGDCINIDEYGYQKDNTFDHDDQKDASTNTAEHDDQERSGTDEEQCTNTAETDDQKGAYIPESDEQQGAYTNSAEVCIGKMNDTIDPTSDVTFTPETELNTL